MYFLIVPFTQCVCVCVGVNVLIPSECPKAGGDYHVMRTIALTSTCFLVSAHLFSAIEHVTSRNALSTKKSIPYHVYGTNFEKKTIQEQIRKCSCFLEAKLALSVHGEVVVLPLVSHSVLYCICAVKYCVN